MTLRFQMDRRATVCYDVEADHIGDAGAACEAGQRGTTGLNLLRGEASDGGFQGGVAELKPAPVKARVDDYAASWVIAGRSSPPN